MATRYLIGTGARNWNDTANWSETSGGAGGASVPTEADDVVFDNNSGTGTVTVNAIANMLNFTCSNISAITISNAAYAFNVFGSLSLHTNLTVTFTGTGYLYLKATDSRNITCNGKVANWNRMYFDGVGGTWNNQDDMNISNCSLHPINGYWDMNNKNITTTNYILAQNGAITINFRSSIFSCKAVQSLNNGLFFTESSTLIINIIAGDTNYIGSSSLFNNIIINGAYHNTNFIVTGEIKANNLTINGRVGYRLLLRAANYGVIQKISVNSTITAFHADFRDVNGFGSANWNLSAITGGSGDCGGNSGITFTPPQTQYFKHTLGAVNWSDATKWFSNYERTIAGRVPLPQDDAIFDENSFTGASTLNVNVPIIGGLNMEGVNQAVTFSLVNNIEVYGNFILGVNIITGKSGNLFLMGRNNHILNVYNNTLNGSISVFGPNGIYTSKSSFGCANFACNYLATFYFMNYNYSMMKLIMQDNPTKGTIYLGSSIITITSTNNYSFHKQADAYIYPETSTVIIYPPIANVDYILNMASTTPFNKIILSGLNTGHFLMVANTNVAELIIDAGRKVRFTAGTTQTVSKLTAIGTPDKPITIDSTTASRFNLVKTGSEPNECNFIDISNSNASPSGSWPAGYNSNDMGNNAGWEFNTDDFVPQIINF